VRIGSAWFVRVNKKREKGGGGLFIEKGCRHKLKQSGGTRFLPGICTMYYNFANHHILQQLFFLKLSSKCP
jgi:hypothetical protein